MGVSEPGGDAVLLDSVIVIDHLNGIEAATRFLSEASYAAAVSAITRAEVLAGYDDGEAEPIAQLLDHFRQLPIDARVADLAARLRRRHGWKLPDALQAAVANRHRLRLATRNTRDFPPAEHAFVLVPYEA